jgi:biopolymer transport protein ExbD
MITETDETTVVSGPIEEEAGQSPLARRPRKRERLEFALPTINIIVLLMLYFLVAGTLVQKNELGVAPPETAKVASDRLPRPLLSISEEGAMMLDGTPVARADLVAAAQNAVGDNAQEHQLNILAPADMSATPFLDILSGLAAANVPVRIVTVPKDKSGDAP